MSIKDLRRTDQRGQTLANPVWLTSAEIDASCDDAQALLFTLPKPGQKFIVHDAVADITEAFAGGTVACTVGLGSVATDDVSDGDTLTAGDVDAFLDTTDLGTMNAIAVKPAAHSALSVAIKANTLASPRLIKGAATTVPAIYALLSSSGTISAGKFRVKLLVSTIDGI